MRCMILYVYYTTCDACMKSVLREKIVHSNIFVKSRLSHHILTYIVFGMPAGGYTYTHTHSSTHIESHVTIISCHSEYGLCVTLDFDVLLLV